MNMNLQNKRILLTGATGGIGKHLASKLAANQASLLVTGRNKHELDILVSDLAGAGASIHAVTADLASAGDVSLLYNRMTGIYGGMDILINNAGTMEFREYESQSPESIDRIIAVNIAAPMQLTRLFLPDLIKQGHGRIVNIGSVFGTIAFPCFASYSTSKFAIRGLSESLRRELAGTGVGVTYVAPRAVRTSLNPEAVYRMSKKLGMHFDEPDIVAEHIIRAIVLERANYYIGFPESLFARLNALFPKIIDRALSNRNRILKEYARLH